MKIIFRNISIFKKILFFSFGITFLVTGISIFFSSAVLINQAKERFTGEFSSLTALSSTSIDADHVINLLESESAQHPSYEKLTNQLSLITEKNSPYYHAKIVLPKEQKVFVIVSSDSAENNEATPFTYIAATEEYIKALSHTMETGEASYSENYQRGDSVWFTAFSPIENENGDIVAVLGMDANTTYLQTYQRKGYLFSFIVFSITMMIAFFLLKIGINKILKPIMEKNKIAEDLQRTEKMNAIGQLAASVAHEIRNPMTVVKGFLQIFLSKEKLTSKEQMYVKLMIDEMNRAETIINDYLSLAKPDVGEREKVNAEKMAHKAMDLIYSYAMMSKNIELKTIIEENFCIRCNKNELQQVLVNILKNGIEAMKEGGILTLKTYKDSSYGIFEVYDTGIGMTQEEVKKLGTAFYSLKEKGTGMGLMVCFQIIERMNGSIVVHSEKGVGTVFTIKIPLDTRKSEIA